MAGTVEASATLARQGTGADVTGVVRAPLAQVWERFKAFGPEVMAWWPIYESMALEAPARDEVGCVRAFKTKTGRSYRERLTGRDDATHTLTYELVEVSPAVPTLTGIDTVIEFQAKGDGETVVHWRSFIRAGSIFLGKIIATQEEVYQAAIASLDRSFNPSLGTLEVKVVGASGLPKHGLFNPDPYVVADLDEVGPQATRPVLFTTHPSWNETLRFDVLKADGQLRLSVWDARALGHDEFLGAVTVDLHDLISGVEAVRKLTLTEGKGELAVALTLRLEAGDALAYTEATERLHEFEHLLHVLDGLKGQAMEVVTSLAQGDPARYDYARYPRDPNFPDTPFEDLPKMTAGYPAGQLLAPRKVGRVAQRLAEYAYSQAQFLNRVSAEGADPWRAMFGEWDAAPEAVIAKWQTDEEFCRQLLQGVNPMVIARLSDPAGIPPALAGLTAQGLTAGELASAGRLFVLDYAELTAIPQYRDMVFYAPIALVYREELGEGASRLNMLGFVLEREADAEVFAPGQTPPNRYTLARLHLACADNQYHQFIFHLGFAHLAMEPFAIAHHNCFPAGHPVGRLMAPHFRDTIGINTLARQTLVSPVVPFTDRTFSPGTSGALKLFLAAWRKWDFVGNSFPAHLAARGFDEQGSDGVVGYHYRDDGFKIWNALLDYTREVIDAAYADDAAVAADPVLRGWCEELRDPERGAIPSFPAAIADRATLSRVLTTIIFNVSAQHSAVNFPQWHYLSYVPNRPDSMFARMPADRGEVTPETIRAALPSLVIGQFQVSFAYLLTTPSEYVLSDLEGCKDLYPAIHVKYVARLQAVSEEIQARNAAVEAKGGMGYPYLQPERIAASIDI
jgi:arachidonate 5-lipoxygenase